MNEAGFDLNERFHTRNQNISNRIDYNILGVNYQVIAQSQMQDI